MLLVGVHIMHECLFSLNGGILALQACVYNVKQWCMMHSKLLKQKNWKSILSISKLGGNLNFLNHVLSLQKPALAGFRLPSSTQ